jgi:hypothetical protein
VALTEATDPVPPAAPADQSRRDEIAVALFGLWAVVGLHLDGWAHMHQRPESFFTLWHAVLYSGVGSGVAYFVVTGRRRAASGTSIDPLVVIGLGLFGVGAVADFIWHGIFGIEVNLETLLSPTHLMLMASGFLMLSYPLRAAWNREDDEPTLRTLWPAILSITLVTAVAAFFLMYLNAFRFGGLFHERGFVGEIEQIHGIAAALVTNVLLLAPSLFVLRRWRPPFGTFTVMYTGVAVAAVGMDEFRIAHTIAMAITGGVVADLLARRTSTRAFAAVVPLTIWTTWFVADKLANGVDWAPELIVGTIFLNVLAGIGLSLLAEPPRPAMLRSRVP